MKKIVVILLLVVMLSGCGAVETFETMGSVAHVSPTEPQLRQVVLSVPESATLEASSKDMGLTMYYCDGYLMQLQTFSSGDLSATIRSLSGFEMDALTVMQSSCKDHTRYEWVWTAVGDEGDVVCRGAILDDGGYHYTLCVVAVASEAGDLAEQWNALFGSFCLET